MISESNVRIVIVGIKHFRLTVQTRTHSNSIIWLLFESLSFSSLRRIHSGSASFCASILMLLLALCVSAAYGCQCLKMGSFPSPISSFPSRMRTTHLCSMGCWVGR